MEPADGRADPLPLPHPAIGGGQAQHRIAEKFQLLVMGMQAAGGVGERFVELGEFAALERLWRGEAEMVPELLQLLATGGIDGNGSVGHHGNRAARLMIAVAAFQQRRA
ncbi:MAG: hypothetical protein ACPG3W_07600 [Synechococcus sp.]